MSALKFLSKKSWHTATIRNNEKVWKKEQEAAKEKERIDELQKQLAEERKLAEVQRLELESGRLGPGEVLKRRRLNWMYEHGPVPQEAAEKEKDEQEKEDVLLGKKEINLEKLSEKAKEEKVAKAGFLVDAEAKLREDPLLLIQQQKSRSWPLHSPENLHPPKTLTRNPPKHSTDELAAKIARREKRRKIRDERRRRREERSSRKRGRRDYEEPDHHHTDRATLKTEVEPTVPRCSAYKSPIEDDRPEGDGSGMRERRDQKQQGLFGLHVPIGGTRVAVTKEFAPRNRIEGSQGTGAASRETGLNRRLPLHQQRRVDRDDRRRKLQEMKENALHLETQRRQRVEENATEASREARDLQQRSRNRHGPASSIDFNDPTQEFARAAIAHGRTTADRISQRRAWATRDNSASY